jgi:hypothetical protein
LRNAHPKLLCPKDESKDYENDGDDVKNSLEASTRCDASDSEEDRETSRPDCECEALFEEVESDNTSVLSDRGIYIVGRSASRERSLAYQTILTCRGEDNPHATDEDPSTDHGC